VNESLICEAPLEVVPKPELFALEPVFDAEPEIVVAKGKFPWVDDVWLAALLLWAVSPKDEFVADEDDEFAPVLLLLVVPPKNVLAELLELVVCGEMMTSARADAAAATNTSPAVRKADARTHLRTSGDGFIRKTSVGWTRVRSPGPHR
jgi:hypothetical protein